MTADTPNAMPTLNGVIAVPILDPVPNSCPSIASATATPIATPARPPSSVTTIVSTTLTHGVRAVLAAHEHDIAEVAIDDPAIHLDINTPGDIPAAG